MKRIQSRKEIYDGVLSKVLYDGFRFTVYDHAFESVKLITDKSHKFLNLKNAIPNLDFLQIAAASGFQGDQNPDFRKYFDLPAPDGDSYYSADGLPIYYAIRDNLLYLFSFGEVQPGRYFLYSEGVWELFILIAVSLFKDVTGTLDDLNLKELVNQQDYNPSVFDAVWNILQPQQQEQYNAYNNSEAARQYREHRDAVVPFVDFHHLPKQLADETIQKIIAYDQDAPLRYIMTDLLSEDHKGQIARYQSNLREQEKAAKRALMTDQEKQKEKEWWDNYNADPTPRFFGNMGEPDTVEGYVAKYGVDPTTGRPPVMDLQELHDKLIANGCSQFYIDTIGGPENSDVDRLGFSDGSWNVYYSERGRHSKPFFSTPDKDEAIEFYYKHIRSIEHHHSVVYTRDADLLQQYKERLEDAGVTPIQSDLPDYQFKGDHVYALQVINFDIFTTRHLFPVVPYYDAALRKKQQGPDTEKEQPSENSTAAIPAKTNADVHDPKNTADAENPEAVPATAPATDEEKFTFVPYYDQFHPATAAHNTKQFNKDFRKLAVLTVISAVAAISLHQLHAENAFSMALFAFILFLLLLIWFRYKQDLGQPAFAVDEAGVSINQQFLRNAFVPWPDISKVELRGKTTAPAIAITFGNLDALLKGQSFILRSIAKANLKPVPTIVISANETVGNLEHLYLRMQEIMKPGLQAEKEIKTVYYGAVDYATTVPDEPYTRLEDNWTKTYFREIVAAALSQAKADYERHPDFPFHESFYNQLKDIQETVIEQNVVYRANEASKRYPIGYMAVRNFEDDPRAYIKQLSDIASGISDYPEMPEK